MWFHSPPYYSALVWGMNLLSVMSAYLWELAVSNTWFHNALHLTQS